MPARRWALAVVGLYVAALLVIAWPLVAAGLGNGFRAAAGVYAQESTWIWIALMALSQWTLLRVQVRAAAGRPAARRPLLAPVIAGGFLAAILAVGVILSVRVLAWGDETSPGWFRWGSLALVVGTWLGWSVLFHRMGRASPEDAVAGQCRALLRGSVLELLIAVPTHVVARHRHLCCGDTLTLLGISFGISVMLLAFGPAVFLLFADRWKRLHLSPGEGAAASRPARAL